MRVSGQVQAIVGRETRAGTFYDVKVNGKNYGHGKFAPRDVREGDFVSFDVDVKQNGQYTNYDIRRGTLKRDDDAGSAKEAAPKADAGRTWSERTAPSTGGGTAKGGYVPFDERQEIISKQAALNTALALCNLAASQGAVPMPKAVKEADKLGLIQGWVLDEASRLYKLTTGRTWDIPADAAEPALMAKPKATAAKKSAQETMPDEVADTGFDEYPE